MEGFCKITMKKYQPVDTKEIKANFKKVIFMIKEKQKEELIAKLDQFSEIQLRYLEDLLNRVLEIEAKILGQVAEQNPDFLDQFNDLINDFLVKIKTKQRKKELNNVEKELNDELNNLMPQQNEK
jgi:hypothetical protein